MIDDHLIHRDEYPGVLPRSPEFHHADQYGKPAIIVR